MTYKQLLFSFKGRIDRKTYWKVLVLTNICFFILIIGLLYIYMIYADKGHYEEEYVISNLESGLLISIVGILVLLTAIRFFINYAIGIKRLHDFNFSGWWQILFMVAPLIFIILETIIFWIDFWRLFFVIIPIPDFTKICFLIFGCIPTKEGENKYGSPPNTKNLG